MPGISKRLKRAADTNSFLVHGLDMYRENPYHVINNPEGIVNFGTAENQLMHDEVHKRISEVNLSEMPISLAKYNNFTGNNEFRDHLARFVNHYMKPTMQVCPNNLVVFNGAGPVVEGLGFSICDPDEGILIPAPFYGCFKSDLGQRNRTEVCDFSFPVNYKNNPDVISQTLGTALKAWQSKGIKIRAMVVTNPDNPTGVVYNEIEMRAMLEFCFQHDLHFIADEVYFFSVYDESVKMKSMLSIPDFEKYKDIIHIVWAFSKDFGLSGFRCGILITFNKELYLSICEMSLFFATSSISQHITQHLIDDFDWVDQFVSTNHKHLRGALKVVTSVFDDLDIEYIKPSAGLYIWFNMQKFMTGPPSEEQDRAMFHRLMKSNVYTAPGFAFFAHESGWFRIIFSIDPNELKVGMERFRKVVIEVLNERKLGGILKAVNGFDINGNVGDDKNTNIEEIIAH